MRTATIQLKPDQLRLYIHDAVIAAFEECYDPDFGLEIRPQFKKKLARAKRAAKTGRLYTLEEVRASLKLPR